MAEKICAAAEKKYGSKREFLWQRSDNSVLRRGDNKKWYACFIRIPRSKLGLPSDEHVDIIDIKCDPMMSGSLRSSEGYFPAYHMNKSNWITVILDGTVPLEDILALLDISYTLASGKKR